MAEARELQVQETKKQELAEGSAERTRERLAFIPRADIYENDDAIVVIADMPGVDENSVEITLENRVLSIKGYVEPVWPENQSLVYAEYRVGDFERRFTLSDTIDQNGIGATVRDGVLRLHLPKAQPEMKKIAVKAA